MRLEEDPLTNGEFWKRQPEIYPLIVEAMNEAALITGYVQTVSQQFTIPASTNYVAMPKGWISILTIRGPQAVRKTEIYALDKLMPGWEGVGGASALPPVAQIQSWFPVGLTAFGVYPQLTVPQQVIITALAYPVIVAPPYTGTEIVPFTTEYLDGIESYAASCARYKEAGLEMETASAEYQQFLTTMKELSGWMDRHDTLVFSRSVGSPVRINPTMVK
jgi:hypothetical protein